MSYTYKKRTKKKDLEKITKAVLTERYEKEKLSLKKIADQFGICVSTMRKLFRRFGIKTRKSERKINLVGKRFNKFTVLGEASKPEHLKSRWVRYWTCKCDCGQTRTISSGNLIRGGIKSCGCSRLYKNKKLTEKYGEDCYKNCITSVYWIRLWTNATRRNIEFDIDIEYAYEKYIEQGGKCAYTGRDIAFVTNYNKNGPKQTASLDRIDSSKGYIKGNVQWVHKDINRMKSNFSGNEFLKICKEVSDHKKLC